MVIRILVTFWLICSCQCVTFGCEYRDAKYPVIANVYECNIKSVQLGCRFDFEGVEGNHTSSRSDTNVTFIRLFDKILYHFPRGIENVFPNVIGIQIHNTGLRSISAEDLKHFSKLQYLHLEKNQIVSLAGDLFKYSPKLKDINFDYNSIEHVGENLISNLTDLEFAYFRYNPCINHWTSSKPAMQDLEVKLIQLCGSSQSLINATYVDNMKFVVENAKLETELSSAKKQLVEITNIRSLWESLVNKTLVEIMKFAAENAKLETELSSAKKQLEEMKIDIDSKRQEISDLNRKVLSEGVENIENREKIKRLQDKIDLVSNQF